MARRVGSGSALASGMPEVDFQGLLHLTQDLIGTPSLPGQEGRVAEILAEAMLNAGFQEIRTDAVGNVVGRYAGPGGLKRNRRTVLFDGHMDTVDVGDRSAWQHDPFGADIVQLAEGPRLYGRGASDMKSALAAMIYSVKWLADNEIALGGDLVVAFVVQEEPCEGVAVRQLLENEDLQPAAVVLGEPTNLGVYLGQRGRVELKVAAYGKAGHAAVPQGGVNAISAAARLIFGIELLGLQLHTDPRLGSGSIAVTQITSNAGSLNSIPDLCELIVDRRLTLGETEARAVAELQAIITRERIRADVSTLGYEMTTYTGYRATGRKYFPPWMLPEDDPIARKSVRAIEKVLGVRPKTAFWPFSTDGAYTMGTLGIPTIGFGPGEERFAHAADEYVRVADIALAALGYAQLAIDLLPTAD